MSLQPTMIFGLRASAPKSIRSRIRLRPYPPRIHRIARVERDLSAVFRSAARWASLPARNPCRLPALRPICTLYPRCLKRWVACSMTDGSRGGEAGATRAMVSPSTRRGGLRREVIRRGPTIFIHRRLCVLPASSARLVREGLSTKVQGVRSAVSDSHPSSKAGLVLATRVLKRGVVLT